MHSAVIYNTHHVPGTVSKCWHKGIKTQMRPLQKNSLFVHKQQLDRLQLRVLVQRYQFYQNTDDTQRHIGKSEVNWTWYSEKAS